MHTNLFSTTAVARLCSQSWHGHHCRGCLGVLGIGLSRAVTDVFGGCGGHDFHPFTAFYWTVAVTVPTVPGPQVKPQQPGREGRRIRVSLKSLRRTKRDKCWKKRSICVLTRQHGRRSTSSPSASSLALPGRTQCHSQWGHQRCCFACRWCPPWSGMWWLMGNRVPTAPSHLWREKRQIKEASHQLPSPRAFRNKWNSKGMLV